MIIPQFTKVERLYPLTTYRITFSFKTPVVGVESEISINGGEFEVIANASNQIFVENYPINTLFQLRIRGYDEDMNYTDWNTYTQIRINEQSEIFSAGDVQTPTNFNFYNSDFNLMNHLSNEVVQMRGIDVIYLPKQFQKVDLILGEDVLSKFETNYPMKMYLQSFSEFGGDGSVFGHFGLQVDDQAIFEVNISQFEKDTMGLIPLEGDLIYVPMGKWVMELFHENPHDPFFLMGQRSKYILSTRKYEYSHEELDTGIEEFDKLEDYQSTDIESENDEINDDLNDILNSAEPNIFGDR
jgi:hypothetical protein